MRAVISTVVALGALVVLLRMKVKIGRSMILSALVLSVFLGVGPQQLWRDLAMEWASKPVTQTTAWLLVSLTALVIMVNVFGAAMRRTAVSSRLAPAMQGLFRSRRLALAAIPFMMGMLPTPGGIMLSAPTVRDFGDHLAIDRSRLAAINFYFRHQWESVWPLFPAIPLVQGILGVSAFSVVSANALLWLFGVAGGVIFLLLVGPAPQKSIIESQKHRFARNLRDFAHALWPIVLTAVLYTAFSVPPALGISAATVAFLLLHRIQPRRWPKILKDSFDPDLVLLITGALLFKTNLEAARAISEVMNLLDRYGVSPYLIIFLLPMLVCYLTGIASATIAVTFPLLAPLIGTGAEARMGLEALGFSGLLFGLFITPVHLCLPLSAAYFEVPLQKIIVKLLLPAVLVAAAGVIMAVFL